jgi:hypothetical protein
MLKECFPLFATNVDHACELWIAGTLVYHKDKETQQ